MYFEDAGKNIILANQFKIAKSYEKMIVALKKSCEVNIKLNEYFLKYRYWGAARN
jgi:hypothetical protein